MKARRSTDPFDIELALRDLLDEMNEPEAEFPDVSSRIARLHNVDYDSLRAAYDEACL